MGIYKCCLAYPAPSSRSAVIRMAMVVMVMVRPAFWKRDLISVDDTITKRARCGQVRRQGRQMTLVPAPRPRAFQGAIFGHGKREGLDIIRYRMVTEVTQSCGHRH